MKINLHVTGIHADTHLSQATLTLVGTSILLAGLAFLPAPALFLAALIGATGLALPLAELRRHGSPGTPALPPMTEH